MADKEDLREILEKARQLNKNRSYDLALSLCEEAEAHGHESAELFALHAEALACLEQWQKASKIGRAHV